MMRQVDQLGGPAGGHRRDRHPHRHARHQVGQRLLAPLHRNGGADVDQRRGDGPAEESAGDAAKDDQCADAGGQGGEGAGDGGAGQGDTERPHRAEARRHDSPHRLQQAVAEVVEAGGDGHRAH